MSLRDREWLCCLSSKLWGWLLIYKLTSSYFIDLRSCIWYLVSINYLLNNRGGLNSLINIHWRSHYNWGWRLLYNVWVRLRRLHYFWLEIWCINNVGLNLRIVSINTSLTIHWSLWHNYWFLDWLLSPKRSVIFILNLLWNCTCKCLRLWTINHLTWKSHFLLLRLLIKLLSNLLILSFPIFR